MSFTELLGNRAAIERLQNMVSRGQVPTSLLFSGLGGVGKLEAAVSLAKALNCARSEPGSNDACDQCSPCRRIESGNFPDVRCIGPEGSGGQIKAEAVRQVVNESPFRPFEGRKRVYIFEAADRMNPTAANTLLKTLEESPPWILLILLTAHEAAILPTLLSRCQKIRFTPLLPEDVAEELTAKHGFSTEGAALAASVSGGSLSKALATKTDELIALRTEALELAEVVPERLSRADIFAQADGLSKHSQLNSVLRLLLGLLRDLTCFAGGETNTILHFDLAEDLQALASRAPLDAWLQAYSLAESCLHDLEVRYANKRITLEHLLLGLSGLPEASPALPGRAIRARRSARP